MRIFLQLLLSVPCIASPLLGQIEVEADWHFTTHGRTIGLEGFFGYQDGQEARIVSSADGSYFKVSAFDSSTQTYSSRFTSPLVDAALCDLAHGDINGDGKGELLSLYANGQLIVRDDHDFDIQEQAFLLADSQLQLRCGDFNPLVQGDEVAIASASEIRVYLGDLTLWRLIPVGALDIEIGQVDDDPSMELLTDTGLVIDLESGLTTWDYGPGFGIDLVLADVDGDGRDELMFGEQYYWARCFDVDLFAQKWQIPVSNTNVVWAGDVDQDSQIEFVFADGHDDDLFSFDGATGAAEQVFVNRIGGGVPGFFAMDLDADGANEIVWASGAFSTGPDRIVIAEVATGAVEWKSEPLDTPFLGPISGDLDGDGVEELVAASFTTKSGSESARLIVFSGVNLETTSISAAINAGFGDNGIQDIAVADIDGDGSEEIFVAGSKSGDGVIEGYRYSAGGVFTLVWRNAFQPNGAAFYSLAIEDVDGDGVVEILGGAGRNSTGASGVFVYAFDSVTMTEKWHSPQLGSYWAITRQLKVTDIDGDGNLEIAAIEAGADCFILDGLDGTILETVDGQFTAVNAISGRGSQPDTLLLGDFGGRVRAMRWQASQLVETQRGRFGNAPISGITFGPNGTILIGVERRVRAFRLSDLSFLGETAAYGDQFGRWTAFRSGYPGIFAAGDAGVFGFLQ